MNSDNTDVSADIDDNIIVDIDPLLRALASRAKPNTSDDLVNFKKFANTVETINGEPPFGIWNAGFEERPVVPTDLRHILPAS